MAILPLYRGGTSVLQFPVCDGSSEFGPPFPHRIAYEYTTGEFTLGDKLDPSMRTYQRAIFNDLENGPAVGDEIQLLLIPQEHILTGVFVAVEKTDARMAGASVSVTTTLYDHTNNTYTKLNLLGDTVNNIPLDTETSIYVPITATEANPVAPYFVQRHQTLILGFGVTAVPTDTSISLTKFAGKLKLVAKVGGFDCPDRM